MAFFILVSNHTCAETLEDALSDAYETNPQLLSERAHLRAVDEGVPQALANWRPEIEFSGSAGAERATNSPYQPSETFLLAPPGCATPCIGIPTRMPSTTPAVSNTTPNTIDITVTQPLYRGGRTVAQTAVAEKTVQAERAKLVATEGAVLFAVVQAYLDVVRDQAILGLSRANEQLLQKQLESTEKQYRIGSLTRTDVSQAKAQYENASAGRNQAEGNLQVSRAAYERVVGHLPPWLSLPTLRPVLPATFDEALALATKNPTVISALFSEDAAREQVKVIRGQLLPTISIVGEYQRLNDVAFLRSDTVNASVIARMTMPLYEGGSVYSQTRQAVQVVGQLQGVTDDTRRLAIQNATQAWQQIVAARAQQESLHEAEIAAEAAFLGIQAEQRVGTRTILDVLITEQQLYSTRTQLVTVQHDLVLAQFNLAQQIGKLTASDLRLGITLYNVDSHYRKVRDKWLGFD